MTDAPLETEIRQLDPRSLKLLDRNARFMTPQQAKRLADNIKRDGALTSVPLCAPTEDGGLEVLSGNHRVEAARQAGLETIPVMVITSPIDRQRRVAIQLAHNAIAGQDDPNILAGLYAELDLESKAYSGLTDDAFKGLAEVDIAGLSVGSVKYREITALFLPEDEAEFKAALDRVKRAKDGRTLLVAHRDDFDRFFDTLIAVKENRNVHNTAVALRMMADLAMERLEQLEHADDRTDAPDPAAAA